MYEPYGIYYRNMWEFDVYSITVRFDDQWDITGIA